jgi:hypothetical protein
MHNPKLEILGCDSAVPCADARWTRGHSSTVLGAGRFLDAGASWEQDGARGMWCRHRGMWAASGCGPAAERLDASKLDNEIMFFISDTAIVPT